MHNHSTSDSCVSLHIVGHLFKDVPHNRMFSWVYTADIFISGCCQRLPIRSVQNTVIDNFRPCFHVSHWPKINVKIQLFSVLTCVVLFTMTHHRFVLFAFDSASGQGKFMIFLSSEEQDLSEQWKRMTSGISCKRILRVRIDRLLEKDKCIFLSLQSLLNVN